MMDPTGKLPAAGITLTPDGMAAELGRTVKVMDELA